MNILGLDTSTAATAVCVFSTEGQTFEVVPPVEALGATPRHAQELLPAVAQVMDGARLSWDELDSIAVGCGPGSFTGLRIGVSTARALAAAGALELRPVSSLAALAEGLDGPLRLPLIDARRGELFGALYAEGEERWARFVASPEEVTRKVRETGLSPRAAGDGALRFREVLEAAGVQVEPEASTAHVVRALHVCRLALATPPSAPHAVVPDYIRPPDATPSR